MNPEFLRNVWLELSVTRVLGAALVLGLIAGGVFLIGEATGGDAAEFYSNVLVAITVVCLFFWGPRNAAASVIGEIRERTWDFQRMSALAPFSMTLGKLFGATSFVWIVALFAIALAFPAQVYEADVSTALASSAVLVAAGVIGQAVAMMSALAAARRRQTDAKLGLLPHQLLGFGAASVFVWAWNAVQAGQLVVHDFMPGRPSLSFSDQAWWGLGFDPTTLFLLSSAAFGGWAIAACWRQMRLELMMRNMPIVYSGFAFFLSFWVAGFGGTAGEALALVCLAMFALTVVSVIAEPKRAIDLRRLGTAIAEGDLVGVAQRMPGYLIGFGFAFLASVLVFVVTAPLEDAGGAPSIFWLGACGFLARDIGLFVFFNASAKTKRADFAAILVIVLLYSVIGSTLELVGDGMNLSALVRPSVDAAGLALVVGWISAAIVWAGALKRLSRRGG